MKEEFKKSDRAISLNAVIATIYSSGNFKNDFDQGFFADKIRDLPPVTPCEDAISRDAVLEKAGYTETEEGWSGYTVDVDYIKSLPSVNPQEPSNDMVSRGVFEQVMWERDIAIEQLEELGYSLGEKIEPQDGDLISRKALLEKKWDVLFNGKYIQVVDVGDIENAPPISQTREGHWIWQTEDKYQCSCCGEVIRVKEVMNEPQYITCPMCDARMVGDEDGR